MPDPLDAPLLRSPPLTGANADITWPGSSAPPRSLSDETDRLFAAIRQAKIGGCFWAASSVRTDATIILRPRSASEISALLDTLHEEARASAFWIFPTDATDTTPLRSEERQIGEVDPWSVLRKDVRLIAHGDDEWVALAHIAGCAVDVLSEGRFGEPGADRQGLRQCAEAALLAPRYRNPFDDRDTSIEATIALLVDWRRVLDANQDIVAACGMAWWKRHEIARFLQTPRHGLRFFRSERGAIRHAARHGGKIAVWPSRISPSMAEAARIRNVSLIRVEDGFVRSVGLGSNLVPPSSVVVDRRGIHYDPTRPSDLETLLAEADFPPALLARAEQLQRVIVDAGISKYGSDGDEALPQRQTDRRVVLVPGQVEDDTSVQLGGGGLSSNLELLRRTRALEPDAEIWFRPHPDVDAGHRKGAVRDADALDVADRIVRGGGMAQLLSRIDAVHVLTSLTGFEALLRGKAVTCHGTPFYAGWGLTRDLAPRPERRGRALTLEQLIAGALILYPRYLDPVTGLPCPPEVLLGRMTEGASRNRLSWISSIRRLQGYLTRQRA